MQTYRIEVLINGTDELSSTFSGYDRQQAIAQAFLTYGYEPGINEIKILSAMLIEK